MNSGTGSDESAISPSPSLPSAFAEPEVTVDPFEAPHIGRGHPGTSEEGFGLGVDLNEHGRRRVGGVQLAACGEELPVGGMQHFETNRQGFGTVVEPGDPYAECVTQEVEDRCT